MKGYCILGKKSSVEERGMFWLEVFWVRNLKKVNSDITFEFANNFITGNLKCFVGGHHPHHNDTDNLIYFLKEKNLNLIHNFNILKLPFS